MGNHPFYAWAADHQKLVEPLEERLGQENWALATTGKKEHEENLGKLRAEVRKIYASSEDFQRLTDFRKNQEGLDADGKRQLELIWREYAQSQFPHDLIDKLSTLESEVEGIYSNFRGQIDGQSADNNKIRAILRDENDSEKRRAAWLASKQIGPKVVKKVLEMVAMRNRGAKKCGFADYYRMSLEMDELDERRLFALLEELADKTDRPFRKAKDALDQRLAERFGISVSQLRPWHYSDPFFQEAPATADISIDAHLQSKDVVALTTSTFQSIGLDIKPILAKSDLFGRDGKDQHAFCTMIGRSRDVRVLCNIEQNEYWMSTMLHEFGHAIYDYELDEKLPYFLFEPAHTLSTEAIAMLFGRLTRNPNWLKEILGLPAAEVNKLTMNLKTQQSFSMLVFVRWVLVMCHFERDLYRNPNQDLNRLWWRLVERYQDIRMGEDRNEPDWAAKLHLALAPVYYQNYLLGELIASQLQHVLTHHISTSTGQHRLVKNPEVGKFLKSRYFQKGARLRWDHLLKDATEENLNPDYFIQQFVA